MKWPNIKFFQVIGVLGFSVGIGNAYAGYNNRVKAKELYDHINRMAEEQGDAAAERYANSLYNMLYQDNLNNQHFQFLVKNIEDMRNNEISISNCKLALNDPSLDAATRIFYEAQISNLENSNRMIMQGLTNNHEMLNSLNDSVTIEKSVILQEIEKIRKGGTGTSNGFIGDSMDRVWNDFNLWIQSLDYVHNVAFVNIMGIGLILLSLLQIIFIFYGTFILDYLNLEARYPKLSKIIQLRRTFQQFYLLLNICIIFIVSIIMLFFNLTFFE